MTTVTFHSEGSRLVSFEVKGHSGYAPEGEDIVCAAVTSAVRLIECAVNDVLGLEAEAGQTVTFDQVLAVLDGDKATFGAPTVEGASVDATVVKNGKGKKIRIFKYNPKKGYRKRQGHRQPYTKVQIGAIKA